MEVCHDTMRAKRECVSLNTRALSLIAKGLGRRNVLV